VPIACVLLAAAPAAPAATFALPTDGSTVVGAVRIILPGAQNTLLDIMRHFDIGFEEISSANPGVSTWLPNPSVRVVIPARFILPPKPWRGIVVNIPQRRLYYFPAAAKGRRHVVMTYPISIAREGWATPLGSTTIRAKYRDPAWIVPQSIRDEHRREDGVEFPEYFPPGPDNPMGMLAMRTGFPGIFIHATNHPWGVGMRTSHGCLHLYPEDAAELYPLVKRGTPVRVIDAPFLVGNDHGHWLMASYAPVAEYPVLYPPFTRAVDAIVSGWSDAGTIRPRPDIAWARVRRLAATPQSVPVNIGLDAPDLENSLADLRPEPYAYSPYASDANNAQVPADEYTMHRLAASGVGRSQR
jgi:L,D-transpeptidase ErfK/SrfK